MKALTICQPYAHLIALPDDDERAKRVENRTWATNYRGKLLIHAGVSKKFLRLDDTKTVDLGYGFRMNEMTFGAIVAVCNLAVCFSTGDGYREPRAAVFRAYPWLAGHQHVEGPWCFVLTEVRPLAKPVPCVGAQGFWNPTPEVMESVMEQIA